MASLTRSGPFLLACLLTVAGEGAADAQEYVVAVAEENVRARPNGTKLGTLRRGAPLAAVEERGRWVQASLRGWIWKRSVEGAGGRDRLRVRVASENLRASPSPSGRLLGTVLRGTPMKQLGERGGWARVEYDGWIWQPSLSEEGPDADGGDAAAAADAPGTWAPDRTVSAEEENLRAEPNGARLGRLQRGADLAAIDRRGSWLHVAARGWFWAPSASGAGDRRRVAKEVENFRIAPGAAVQGTLARNAPLRVLGRAGRWLEVEVRGWIWQPSTRALAPADPPQPAAKPGGAPEPREPETPSPAARVPAPPAAAVPPRTLARSVPLKESPDGRLVAQALAGSRVVPLRSEGDWVQVRVEGWVPRELVGAGTPAPRRPGEPITVAMVAADPDGYNGEEATWRLELISVEENDGSRSDFRPGEHYLLTRNLDGEREYVYVALPPGAADTFRKLRAFEPITVRGVVRTGRSALVGNPILEYRELVESGR